jgi:hypothetical protein
MTSLTRLLVALLVSTASACGTTTAVLPAASSTSQFDGAVYPDPVVEGDKITQLERLKKLLDNGTLTQQEFEAEKARILIRP